MYKRNNLVAFFTVFLILMLSGAASAQLGEFAGHMVFNVTLGQSETLQWTIFNSGNTPITYNVTPASITINNVSGLSSANRTNPIMTTSPSKGTLLPRQNQVINVTVYMPAKNNTGGLSWEAIPQVVEVTNNTNPGGAVIQVGVAKIIAINAVNPPTDYALYAGIIITVIIIGGAAYYLRHRKKYSMKSAKKAKTKARTTSRAVHARTANARNARSVRKAKGKRTTGKKQSKRSGKSQSKRAKKSRSSSKKGNTRRISRR